MNIVFEVGEYRVTSHRTSYPSGEGDGWYHIWKYTGGSPFEWSSYKHVKTYSSLGRCRRYIRERT